MNLQELDSSIFSVASTIIANGGVQRPIIIAVSTGGQDRLIDVSQAMTVGDDGKEIVASLIDMIAQTPETAIVAFVSEGWMAVGPNLKRTDRPSEHPSRQEVIVVSYSLSEGARAMSIHRIVRPKRGKPRLERGELQVEGANVERLEGRFFADRGPRTIH